MQRRGPNPRAARRTARLLLRLLPTRARVASTLAAAAITLRWLRGGAYQDIMMLYGCSKPTFYRTAYRVMEAICATHELELIRNEVALMSSLDHPAPPPRSNPHAAHGAGGGALRRGAARARAAHARGTGVVRPRRCELRRSAR